MPLRQKLAAVVVALSLGFAAVPASADEYDAAQAGHPLRMVAYVLHPVGVILDFVLFRPAHWLGSYEPFRTLTGHRE